jgi:predicted ATPase
MNRFLANWASRTVFRRFRGSGNHAPLALLSRIQYWQTLTAATPDVGYRSPVLDSDGHNLAAAFQTIVEIGAEELLHEILGEAFPACTFYCENENSRFSMKMRRNGVWRPLLAAEMSDGTLRFLCLAVALLSPRPPAFLAITSRKTACIARCSRAGPADCRSLPL